MKESFSQNGARDRPVLPDEELELFAQGINYNIY